MPCSTFTTSGLVRCVRLGRSPWEGSAPLVGGWGGPFFVLRWPQPPCVLAVLPGVGIAGDGLAPAGVLLDFQHFLIPFPGRSLGSRLLGYQRPLPPHPLSTLVWGPDVAVPAWLAFLHGETPLPVLGPAQPPLPTTGGHAGRLGASPGPSPPSGRCGGRVAGGLW